jgi:eukaryotic-like serine/threonine-protein kinase
VIQVGEVLDKYELLERVGQGGMAIVYRGLDRSLKRVVAVKILHKHLADYQEARDRFEREAQAVAKLRHENILEIFDYSGAEAAEQLGSSYIVTEFIDGRTLKQAIVDRPIQYPEIGAMVVLQVCRALAHAHAAGILHRDVKPENIMVRADGVVKLMDFGISHMVDLERLTVTGQLLGSPAYMAPEHVEGRPLDFRTDVFAAGIVLYQLTVGKLPFEGKNPHEVLKRIAECKFVDPRQANPQIGNRLGRIILRAMAAEPAHRFPAVGEMVTALEAYLEESGIATDKIAGELARYFQAPAAYEQALEIRLVDHLTTRGQGLLASGERSAALDVFDRVLTIDPDNAKVLGILDGMNRRRRLRQLAIAALGIAVVASCAYLVHRRSRPIDAELPDGPAIAHEPSPTIRFAITAPDELARPVPLPDAAEDVVAPSDARVTVVTPPPDAGAATASDDAGPAVVTTLVEITVSPAGGSRVQLGSGPFLDVPRREGFVMVPVDRATEVLVDNPCCRAVKRPITPGDTSLDVRLEYKPGGVVATCDQPADLTIDGDRWPLDRQKDIFFPGVLDAQTVELEFLFADGRSDRRRISVRSGKIEKVPCRRP